MPAGSRSRSATDSTTGLPVGARAAHARRRIYHARGKVLGGSSSINGMISSAATPWTTRNGRPTRAWRTGTTPTACRTSCGWRRARRRRRSAGGDGPSMLETGPGTNPLFGHSSMPSGGGLRADRRRQRLPPGGLRRLRPQHLPGTPDQRCERVPASGQARPNSRCAGRAFARGALRRHARDRRRVPQAAAGQGFQAAR